MSKNTWDAVLASVPLNRTAGTVTGKGEHYEPEEMSRGHCWEDQPEVLPRSAAIFGQPQFMDLTGRKLGRLVVVGLYGAVDSCSSRRTNGALWVCRCVCGRYQGIRAKTIKSETRDRCDYCDHTRRLAYFASGENARDRASDTTKRRWTLP